MLGAVVQNVLINFVRDREYIELYAKVTNQLQFGARKYLAGRIIWGVYDNRFCIVMERASQLTRVERPFAFGRFRRAQFHKSRPCA